MKEYLMIVLFKKALGCMMIVNKLRTVNALNQKGVLKNAHQGKNAKDLSAAGNKNSPAAVFKGSTSDDYAGKNLSPLQKSILQLKDQINSLKTNDDIDPATRESLLKKLNTQLEDLQKQQEQTNILQPDKDKDKNDNQDKKQNSIQNKTGQAAAPAGKNDTASSLISMGSQLDQINAAGAAAAKAANAAKLEKSKLDYDMNNPNEQSRIESQTVIERRTAQVNKLQDVAADTLSQAAQLSQNITAATDNTAGVPDTSAGDSANTVNASSGIAPRDKSVNASADKTEKTETKNNGPAKAKINASANNSAGKDSAVTGTQASLQHDKAASAQ